MADILKLDYVGAIKVLVGRGWELAVMGGAEIWTKRQPPSLGFGKGLMNQKTFQQACQQENIEVVAFEKGKVAL